MSRPRASAAEGVWPAPRGNGGGDCPLVRPTSGQTSSPPGRPGRPWPVRAALLGGGAILLVGLGAYLGAPDASVPMQIGQPGDGELVHLDTMQASRTTTLARQPHAPPASRGDSYQALLGGYSRHWTADSRGSAERAPAVQALAGRKRLPSSSREALAEGGVTAGSQPSGSADEPPPTDFARSCRGIGLDSWMSWATEGQDQDEATCPTQQSSTACRTRSASTVCGLSWRPLMAAKLTDFPARDTSCAITDEQTDPWWRVAFGREIVVTSVAILGRACHQRDPDKLASCQASLAGFNVRVGNDFSSGIPCQLSPLARMQAP
jgi:hypothetical protein